MTAPTKPGRTGVRALRHAGSMRDMRLAHHRGRRPTPRLTNPLREGLRLERMPDPFIAVLFGATGDLSHRKVVPALYQLWRSNLLPHEYMLVCIGRRPYTDDSFRSEMRGALEKFSRVQPIDPDVWAEFAKRMVYFRLDFDDAPAFDRLAAHLLKVDEEHQTRGNMLFYLATQ